MGRTDRPEDYCPCKINLGDRPSVLPNQNFILKNNLLAKTRAEHGAIGTEEAQTLLSKKVKLIKSKTALKMDNYN